MSEPTAKIDCLASLILPLHGEVENLEALVANAARILESRYNDYEVVLVGDPTREMALRRAHAALKLHRHLRLIELTRPSEPEVAISAGLDAVIGDFVVVLDPATDPPELIPELVDRCRAGADVVYGVRRPNVRQPLWNKVFSRLFYLIVNRMLGLGIQPNATHLRSMSRRAVNALGEVRDRARFLRTLSSYAGFATDRIEYDPRYTPRSERSFIESARLGLSIIVTNSVQPLRAGGLLALVAALLNLLYAAYILVALATQGRLPSQGGVEALQSGVSHFALFLILAALCEYLGRVVDEVMNRPLYFVDREHHSTALQPDGRRNVVKTSTSDAGSRGEG